ncbi:hypothetical protein [Streptomyces sp. SID5789]|uniref:hypothetical protein n=1 Tax=Streptomyces sp. SID5789 TaxID=2690310 RepID=UPI00136D7538|nr:hypothetical protein [Streptomyces sp. SID5789]MZE74671.1 hypothetical protein [Streptomyces sp. SID5789]
MTTPSMDSEQSNSHPTNRAEAWAELPNLIAFRGGYDLWDVETLVRFDGAQRAGARIIKRIEQQLALNNIGHLPGRLPTDSNCRVLLYNKDQPNVGFLIRLIHDLATDDVNENTNSTVYQLKSLLDARTKLECDLHQREATQG